MAKGLQGVPKAGFEKIMANFKTMATLVNGWGIFLKTGLYGTNYTGPGPDYGYRPGGQPAAGCGVSDLGGGRGRQAL